MIEILLCIQQALTNYRVIFLTVLPIYQINTLIKKSNCFR